MIVMLVIWELLRVLNKAKTIQSPGVLKYRQIRSTATKPANTLVASSTLFVLFVSSSASRTYSRRTRALLRG